LIILQREGIAWERKITPMLQKLAGKGTIEQVAGAITSSFTESERYCLLICVINAVLEKNLSPKLVANFRSNFFDRRERFAKLITEALPESTIGQITPLTLPIFASVSGIWPLSHPPQDSRIVLDKPEFAHLEVNFQKQMTCFIETILKGALLGKQQAEMRRRRSMGHPETHHIR
jgi:TetR/AcrR family transcriptional regulator